MTAKLQDGKMINMYLSQNALNFFFITCLFKLCVFRFTGTERITFACTYIQANHVPSVQFDIENVLKLTIV